MMQLVMTQELSYRDVALAGRKLRLRSDLKSFRYFYIYRLFNIKFIATPEPGFEGSVPLSRLSLKLSEGDYSRQKH